MTSTAAALMGAAMFQRKSRAGWLDELAGIRHDALAVPGGEMAVVMSVASGDMGSHAPARGSDDHGGSWIDGAAAEIESSAPAHDAPRSAIPFDEDAVVVHARDIVDATPAAPSLPPPAAAPAPPDPFDDVDASPADDWWAQPAPHPIRPSEMWHPAVAPGELSRDGGSSREQRIESSDLAPGAGRFARFRPAATEAEAEATGLGSTGPIPGPLPGPAAVDGPGSPPAATSGEPAATDEAASTETRAVPAPHVDPFASDAPPVAAFDEPAAPAADPASFVPVTERAVGSAGLLNGPVGRRPRTDRDRPRPSLPTAPIRSRSLSEPEEQSPLPVAPLPPAAPPVRRVDLGGTPEPAPVQAEASMASPALDAAAAAPEAPAAPAGDASALPTRPAPAAPVEVVPVGALDVHREAATDRPAGGSPWPAKLIERSATGELDVIAPIVRVSDDAEARTTGNLDGVDVVLASGWCWVAPEPGITSPPVRIEVPTAVLTFGDGASGLAVVEADGTAFLVVAAGTAELSRGADRLSLVTGSMVLLPKEGRPQIDRAADEEISADPIVSRNRQLDDAR